MRPGRRPAAAEADRGDARHVAVIASAEGCFDNLSAIFKCMEQEAIAIRDEAVPLIEASMAELAELGR